MELFIFIAVVLVGVCWLLKNTLSNNGQRDRVAHDKVEYSYALRNAVMTDAERLFYERLLKIAGEGTIFPPSKPVCTVNK